MEPVFIWQTPPEWFRRSEEHTSELQPQSNLVCRLLLVKKNLLQRLHSLALIEPDVLQASHRHQPAVVDDVEPGAPPLSISPAARGKDDCTTLTTELRHD